MSSLRVRSILMGMALVAALMLALPVSTEAAGLALSARGGDGWIGMVWTWLTEIWNGGIQGVQGAPAASSGQRQLSSADTAGEATTSGTNGTPCGGDQGVCIDPNG